MGTITQKKYRILEIFYRAMRGENISVRQFADEYGVSSKSISRDISNIKNFMSDNRELFGNSELKYSFSTRTYQFEVDEILHGRDIFAIICVLMSSSIFNRQELLRIVSALGRIPTKHDRQLISRIISNEISTYQKKDGVNEYVFENIWRLLQCIDEHMMISIRYGTNGEIIRIHPINVIYIEGFYLLGICEERLETRQFLISEINQIIEHRVRTAE